jgi:hypothetical protein
MIVVFGIRCCGKVDRIPGRCYVVTQCFHLFFLPLVPLGSWLVQEGSEIWSWGLFGPRSRFRGIPIGLCAKSFLMGWLRVLMAPPLLFFTLGELASACGRDLPGWTIAVHFGIAAVFVAALVMLCRPNRATPARVAELMRILGRSVGPRDRAYDHLLLNALRRPAGASDARNEGGK